MDDVTSEQVDMHYETDKVVLKLFINTAETKKVNNIDLESDEP